MKKLLCNKLCMLACILALLVPAIPALAAENALEVQCVDEAGNPVSGVTVAVQNLGTQKWKDKKSDNKGVALLNKLDDGYYRVIGRKEQFAPSLHEFILLKDEAQQKLTLQLSPGDYQAKTWYEDATLSNRSYDLLNQALNALRENKNAEAEKLITESLKIFPSNPDGLLNLGIAYIQQRKWDPAEEVVKKALDSASALATMPQPKGGGGPNFADVIQRIETVQKRIPVLRTRDEGDKALAEKRFSDALAKYEEALKSDPNDPDLHYNVALALANLKRYDEATQAIDRAIKIKPVENAYTALKKQIAGRKENELIAKAQELLQEGQELAKKTDYAGAISKFEGALALVPADKQGVIWEQIAVARGNAGQQDQAIDAFRKAVELAPDNAKYREALAQYYMRVKMYDEALNVYSDPKTAGGKPVDEVLFNLGKTLMGKGSNEIGQLAFEKAIQANPQHAEAYYELGMSIAYGEKKDDKRALELLSKYLELGKDEAHLENTRSVIFVIKKRMEAAAPQ
jgi:tetratricopeptide (TPR) repeat protein